MHKFNIYLPEASASWISIFNAVIPDILKHLSTRGKVTEPFFLSSPRVRDLVACIIHVAISTFQSYPVTIVFQYRTTTIASKSHKTFHLYRARAAIKKSEGIAFWRENAVRTRRKNTRCDVLVKHCPQNTQGGVGLPRGYMKPSTGRLCETVSLKNSQPRNQSFGECFI